MIQFGRKKPLRPRNCRVFRARVSNEPRNRAGQRIFSSVLHQTVKKSGEEESERARREKEAEEGGGIGRWTVNAAENNKKLVRPRATTASHLRKYRARQNQIQKIEFQTSLLHAVPDPLQEQWTMTQNLSQKALKPDDSGKTLSCSERLRSHPEFFVKRSQKRK